ncbi:unnamed protein product [Rotaria magnacalcarata]|nr:unnamed protein product [Rotaria magnacalcarata]CAF4111004.1 unnamed protein product [Rotaria magnacalcarata]CAF4146808.1 unnamed protein product [Rotaria magnacalcarata]CAF4566355.1 unnamed protein product [Rotaria magnacalcarata]
MPPKRGRSRCGGGNRGRGELTGSSKIYQTPKNTEITYKPLEQQSIKLFTISLLILEGTKSMSKVDLNTILKRHFADVKISDI